MRNTKSFLLSIIGFLVIGSIIWISCQKPESTNLNNGSSQTGQQLSTQSAYFPTYTGSYDQLQAISLHRYGGISRITHKGCNCVSCFGMCIEHGILEPAPFSQSTSYNFIMQITGTTTAKIYFIAQPDQEVGVDPTFYVDHNVILEAGSSRCTLLPGAYPYTGTAGQATLGGIQVHYYGTADVNISL